ncbi:hypothetical protein ['Camptotheca acuminata' phytoplasma]|uniref:hypothetical protein n=1 Tax='Camptotheca acuminata' phytoplasma TaxID=3239192 RepID=UPI00351AA6EE
MAKSIYEIEEILYYLKNKPNFRIYLTYAKTNYNLNFNNLYLNYSDIPKVQKLLNNDPHPPFKIQGEPDLNNKYLFNDYTKVLFIQDMPKTNTEDNLTVQTKKDFFKDLEI